MLCVYDKHLLDKAGIKFAPYEIARKFSIEGRDEVYSEQFGFHGFKWTNISKWIQENPQHGITNRFEY